jgi:2'-5' RNA ligase
VGEKKRLFLAADLAIGVTRKIAEASARMRQVAERRGMRVSWVPAKNLHVTLKFLGWASAEAVVGIRDRVQAVVAARRPFEVVARGAGAYPSESAARVLWVGVSDPSNGLTEIATGLEAELETLGFERERRPFVPHVTVGRVKEGKGAEEILAPHRQAELGSTLFREVVLYESTMSSAGSEYTALARLAFAGGSGGGRAAKRQTREVEEGNESEAQDGGDQSA